MILKPIKTEFEYHKVIDLMLELQKQHVDLFPTLFRDYGDFTNFQGMGKKCLSLLKEWAKEKGYYRMELSVSHQNSSAIALYEELGFQKEMMYMSCEI